MCRDMCVGALEHLSDEALVQSLMEYDQNIRSAVDGSGAGGDHMSSMADGQTHKIGVRNGGLYGNHAEWGTAL